MEFLRSIKDAILSVFRTSEPFIDILDILIVAYLVYKIISFLKETRAGQLVKGIAILAVAFFVATFLELKTVTFILQNLFEFGIVAAVVVFQPELRRALEQVGRSKISEISFVGGAASTQSEDKLWSQAILAICDAVDSLSLSKTGALIVLERKTRLGEQINSGTVINADPSPELICNVFFPKSPLHDGAMIVREGRIVAAGCFLPLPKNDEHIPKELGSRHRAAIGMSENSDAIVVIVSEETGVISTASNGDLARGYTPESLKEYLTELFVASNKPKGKAFPFFGRRGKDDRKS